MVQRRYGPTDGAGTVVIEKDADKQIEKGALGTTVYVGILEKGPVNKLFRVATKKEFQRKAGSYIDESLFPDAAFDFYRLGRAAGDLYALRLTDGTEVQSEVTLYGRKEEALYAELTDAIAGGNDVICSDADYAAMDSPAKGQKVLVYDDENNSGFRLITAVVSAAGKTTMTVDGAAMTFDVGATVIAKSKQNNPAVSKFKAHNGGRWGGKKDCIFGLAFGGGGVAAITFDTGVTMLEDYYVGAKLSFAAIPGKSYTVVSNDTDGVLTVTADADMLADYNKTGSSDETWKLAMVNNDKALAVLVKDGVLNPTTEFGIEIYVDGVKVLDYSDLNMDPDSKYYYAKYINDDDNNDFVEVEDLWVGAITANIRPANLQTQSKTLTTTQLTFDPVDVVFDNAGGGDGWIGDFTYGGDLQADTYIIEMVGGAWTVTSAKLGALAGTPVDDTAFAAPNDFGIGFTIRAGATAFDDGDKFTVVIRPLTPGELVGGFLYPDIDQNRRTKYKIEANTWNTITVSTSVNLRSVANEGSTFRVEYAEELGGGYDGLVGIEDSTYINAYDPATTPILSLQGEKKGLVKICTPGVTSAAVQKAGAACAEALNYQYRYQAPSNIVTEDSADAYFNDTLGRNDFAVATFPSFMWVNHPTKAGLKLVPTCGSIHGREALMAKNYDGYHKAAAGVDVTIPHCVKLTTGDKVLNEELLNKKGIGVLKFKAGNCIIWGDRTLSIDPAWKWKHQREQMSHYENDMRESFDWIIYSINDEVEDKKALAALSSYFRPEYKKRALRGADFSDAATIKLDSEINTPATRAAGDMNAEIALRLADTVERFIITMSKMGIFENVS